MTDVEAAAAATPVQVKFTGITLDVKTGKDQTKRILDDVSGHFGPAESVAVMGVGPRRFSPAMSRSRQQCDVPRRFRSHRSVRIRQDHAPPLRLRRGETDER